jgi:hypothetical protein
MPGLTLTFFGFAAAATHAAAAIAFGSYLCRGNDDDPVHDSNYTSSSHNRRTTRVQTQPSYRPPPHCPSHTYRPDLGRGAYHPSAVSPCTRTPSQTQPSSTRTQPPSIAHSASTSSRVPASVPTERDPLLHPVIRSVSRSNAYSPYARTPVQTQLSSTRTQPSSTRTQPSSTLTQPSSTHPFITQSASASSRVPIGQESLPRTEVNGVYHTSVVPPHTRTPSQTQQSSIQVVIPPSSSRSQLPSTVTQPSSSNIQSSSTRTQAFKPHPSLINTVHVPELPESEFSQTRSQAHVPARVHTRNEPPPPTVNQVISSDLRSEQPAGVEDLDFADKLRT